MNNFSPAPPVVMDEPAALFFSGSMGEVSMQRGMAMEQQEQLNDHQRRLLRIVARMPLSSAANLAPILGMAEDRVRRMLATLRSEGWIESVVRGMTERRQHRWFLTRKAVEALYVSGHQHPSPREEARAAGLAEFHPEGNCR